MKSKRRHESAKVRTAWGSQHWGRNHKWPGGYLDQVRHHLSRGRDAGRIAVWMGSPVSRVQEAIEVINNSTHEIHTA